MLLTAPHVIPRPTRRLPGAPQPVSLTLLAEWGQKPIHLPYRRGGRWKLRVFHAAAAAGGTAMSSSSSRGQLLIAVKLWHASNPPPCLSLPNPMPVPGPTIGEFGSSYWSMGKLLFFTSMVNFPPRQPTGPAHPVRAWPSAGEVGWARRWGEHGWGLWWPPVLSLAQLWGENTLSSLNFLNLADCVGF